ncbi:aminoglycoside phosphotransferase family protein [Frankia sp. AiPa1]|uniref:aminoglycoside phosphotransferase family protein n=1 Tax=Frankia sp. AiPa1 TaxID=573492 RepID=UPI00202B1133|nr:aminoglycoside phosphotransferase family protein [Frankia sp. AiPa1]
METLLTPTAPIPEDLHRWAEQHLPGTTRATDTSWPRSTSQVWLVDGESTSVYVKISPSRRAFEREIHAHRHARAALPPTAAPRLIAYDTRTLALLTTAVPGAVVRGLPLDPDIETRVHHLGGTLLRGWHDHPEAEPEGAREAVTASMTAQAAEAALCLKATEELLYPDERELVAEVAHDLVALAAGLPLVYLHGDAAPRNWLWDQVTTTLALIDFETAEHGLAVQDMIWLCGAMWPSQPHLREAYLDGYGRPLTEDEQRLLVLLTARLAVSYLTTGLRNQDQVLIDRGRTALGDLVRTHA